MYKIEDENEFLERIKQQLQDVRKEKGLTQEQLWDKRTSIVDWENPNNTKYPKIIPLLQICNRLDVDIEYLLGLSNVPNKSNKAIADEIHAEELTVASMKEDPFYGRFINGLVKFEILSDLKSHIRTTTMAEMCNSAIEANFTPKLLTRLNTIYESYIYEVFPSDVSVGSFRERLEEELGKVIERDQDKFLLLNFKDEGITNLKNSADKIDTSSILDLIADFAFDYFRTRDIIEKQNERLHQKFVDLAHKIIAEEKVYYTEIIKKNIAAGRLND